jgi:4,5-DOPA dioxygenase extradiol
MIALEPGEAGAFLQRLGPAIDATFGRPRAIVVASAHTTAREPLVLGAAQHETVHDFGGFPEALYRLRYDAPGDPKVAERVTALLHEAGIAAQQLSIGGLDHGIWTALRYVYPEADVPIVPVAWVPEKSPERQFALGQALSALAREDILVVGTGSITHNLQMLFRGGRPAADAPEIPQSAAFRDWVRDKSAAHDWDALFDYRRQAPHAVLMHPTDEHWLPWFVAAGAAGRDAPAIRLHDSVQMGSLGMDSYAFGAGAPQLAAALAA